MSLEKMIVKCTDDRFVDLTYGASYDVEWRTLSYFFVNDDKGDTLGFSAERFIVVQEGLTTSQIPCEDCGGSRCIFNGPVGDPPSECEACFDQEPEDNPVTWPFSPEPKEEYTGASVSYYAAEVVSPTNPDSEPYTAECNDIIEALGMTFAEGNAFKAIWRSCAARKFGKAKKGYDNGLYDAEKVVFFGERMVVCAKAAIADNVKGSDENDAQGSR